MKDCFLRARPFLVYPPLTAGLLVWALPRYDGNWLSAVGLVLGGLFGWTLIEWLFHRAMHVSVPSRAVSRFQDQAHLRHHRHPEDVEHSIVNLRGSVPLAVLLFGVSLLAVRSLPGAILVFSGLAVGYLCYELVHLATHARWRVPGLTSLTAYHHGHHGGNWSTTFGVTSSLWDWAFGTRPSRGATRRPASPIPSR